MKLATALQGVTRLFLDTAPVIYYVEDHPGYRPIVTAIFQRIDAGAITAVTSPMTLAESLVLPYRAGSTELQRKFFDFVGYGRSTVFAAIDQDCARQAAQFRVRYNLGLLDALQIAVALTTGCEALLTNDAGLRRVTDLRVLLLDDLEPD